MDVLGDMLTAMRLHCSVLANFVLSAPWGLDCGDGALGAPFHLVVEGECWLLRSGARPLRLQPGDFVAVPRWDLHSLASSPDAKLTPIADAFSAAGISGWSPTSGTSTVLELFWGGTGAETRILSGVAVFDPRNAKLILDGLPELLHVSASGGEFTPLINAGVDLVREENRQERAGRSAVISRLSEFLFVQIIREHLLRHAQETAGIVRGLSNLQLGKALRAIHSDPTPDWTVPKLAAISGLSRAAFAKHFTAAVGQSPIAYLRHWRMHVAATQIAAGERSTAKVAEACGYDSPIAFAKRFKSEFGVTPSQYRKSAAGRAA